MTHFFFQSFSSVLNYEQDSSAYQSTKKGTYNAGLGFTGIRERGRKTGSKAQGPASIDLAHRVHRPGRVAPACGSPLPEFPSSLLTHSQQRARYTQGAQHREASSWESFPAGPRSECALFLCAPSASSLCSVGGRGRNHVRRAPRPNFTTVCETQRRMEGQD